MVRINRRKFATILTIIGAFIAVAPAISDERPALTEADAQKSLSKLLYGVYQDAKAYNLTLKGDYVEAVSKEIWPDVKLILERRFVITGQ